MAADADDLLANWDVLIAQLDPERLRRRLKKSMRVAMTRAGIEFEKRAKEGIDDREYEKNAPLTQALKGSDLPLVDHGDLSGAITYGMPDDFEVQFGVKSPKLSSGRFLYEVLHNGATIRVTPAMRRAVMAKLEDGIDSGSAVGRSPSKHLAWMEDALATFTAFKGDGAAFWIIPPRPFLAHVWEDDLHWRAFVQANYLEALEAAVRPPKRRKGGRT